MSSADLVLVNPSLMNGLAIIARYSEAAYVRLPRELWRDAGKCGCPHCKGNTGYWDTLVIPTPNTADRSYGADHTYTVHMPDGQVPVFIEHVRKQDARCRNESKG